MNSRRGVPFLALAVFAALVLATPRAAAHEGHDHGAPPPPVSKTIAPRAEASSGDFEAVLVARGQRLVVHLDTFRTNEPIAGAEIEIDTPSGVLKPLAVPNEPGSYTVEAPFLARAGSYDLAITVQARDTIDVLAATLVMPEAPATATAASWPATLLGEPASAQELQRRIGDTSRSTWSLIGLGFLAGVVLTRLLWPRRVRAPSNAALILLAVHCIAPGGPAKADGPSGLAARDVAQRLADGALFVPKPTQRILALRTILTEERDHLRAVELPGRIVPSPNASGLVQASVGGRLLPPEGGFKPLGTPVKAGDILAYVRPPLGLADATAQQQQARELDQQISIVTRRVERLRAIERVIAKGQLEDAELELKGLQTRRANLERARAEPEALVAPVGGILAAANAVAGQMAEPNAVIFQIIDPAHLWVEALSYDPQPLQSNARGLMPDGRIVALAHVGTGFTDRNQAIPVHFAIEGDTTGIRAGQLVTVLAATADRRRGVAVPRQSVLRGANGQMLVYEHTNAERFVPREVRIEPLDGTHVLVVAGIDRGHRIVTQGAELLDQIR